VESLKALVWGEEAAGYALTGESSADRLLLAAWLVFHETGRLAAAEDHPPVAASWLGELGLERAFGELVREAPEAVEAPSSGTEAMALLLKPLLRWQRFFAGWERQAASARFTLLFADPGARAFLGCHLYEECEWFNKERFDLLLQWLLVVEALRLAAAGGPERLADIVAPLRKEAHYLQAVAAAANYQPERFLGLLRETANSYKDEG